MKRLYVDRYTGSLERTDLYYVRLTLKDGTVYEDLEPRMLFPLTNQTMYITLLNKEEREVALVRDMKELDEDSIRALQDCFAEYYMIPRITRLVSCEDKFGKLKWVVDTDRGRVEFSIQNRHSDIKLLYGTGRVLVRDSNDNRYEIVDYTKLDAHSNALLFAYL